MNDSRDCPKAPSSKVEEEVRKIRELGEWCTPELLLRAVRVSQGSERTRKEVSDESVSVSGRFNVRGSLLGAVGVEDLVGDLRKLLAESPREKAEKHRRDVLDLWTMVEPHLLPDETRALYEAVMSRVFPEAGPPTLSRDKQRMGGGR